MVIEISTKTIQGLVHLTGLTPHSRYETALMLAERLNFDKNLICSTTMDKMNWIAKRPENSTLDVSNASSILKNKPLSFENCLDIFVDELKATTII